MLFSTQAATVVMEEESPPVATATATAAVDTLRHENESFLTGTSSLYAEQMYELYLQNPDQLHDSWRRYFDNLQAGLPYQEDDFAQPTAAASTLKSAPGIAATAAAAAAPPSDSLGVAHLIRAYQANGHLAAKLDPLDLHTREAFPYRPSNLMDLSATDGYPPELTLEYHGFTQADLDRRLHFRGTSSGGNKGYLEDLSNRPTKVTLRQILNELRKTYCGTLAVEYNHIGDQDRMNWIRERVENPRWTQYDKEKKQHIFERLCFADTFENFLAQKFNTTKRFGLDGGEAVVPALKDAIDRASELGAHSFVIGMPHRGRLNVLANVMRKPMPLIFSEFSGLNYKVEDHYFDEEDDHSKWSISGDVKYHLGSSMDRTYPDGRHIHLSLVANPSHLECVNPVVSFFFWFCSKKFVWIYDAFRINGSNTPYYAILSTSFFFFFFFRLRGKPGPSSTIVAIVPKICAMLFPFSCTGMPLLRDKVSFMRLCK